VVAARERELNAPVTLDSLAGMGWERPYHGIALWIFMLGMAGFPLTGGMFGKLFVFSAAYDAGDWWLVLLGVAVAKALAAVADQLPRGGSVNLSYGDDDIAEYIRQLTADHLIHGWDLAAATGQDRSLDPEVVAEVAAWYRDQETSYRSSGSVAARPASSSPARSRMRACISSILSLIACMSSGVNRGSPPVPIIRREICRKSTASSPSMAPIWTTCGNLSATAASLSRTSCWKRYSRISGAAALLTIEAQNTDKLALYLGECRERGIPVVVSFGSVAASGGYWIATAGE
jgi:hypothetical protein